MIKYAFDYVSTLVGGRGTAFLMALLFVILIRICVAFVFKLLRMNIDYHKLPSVNRTRIQHSQLKK